MAIKVVDTLFSKLPKMVAQANNSQAYLQDQLLYEAIGTGNYVLPVTSSAGTVQNIIGISTKAFTAAASGTVTVNYIPVVTGAVFVVADCTNNTATTNLHINHLMTDGQTINNGTSNTATTSAIFHALAIVGSLTNKKLYGYFIAHHQVDA